MPLPRCWPWCKKVGWVLGWGGTGCHLCISAVDLDGLAFCSVGSWVYCDAGLSPGCPLFAVLVAHWEAVVRRLASGPVGTPPWRWHLVFCHLSMSVSAGLGRKLRRSAAPLVCTCVPRGCVDRWWAPAGAALSSWTPPCLGSGYQASRWGREPRGAWVARAQHFGRGQDGSVAVAPCWSEELEGGLLGSMSPKEIPGVDRSIPRSHAAMKDQGSCLLYLSVICWPSSVEGVGGWGVCVWGGTWGLSGLNSLTGGRPHPRLQLAQPGGTPTDHWLDLEICVCQNCGPLSSGRRPPQEKTR